MGRFYTIACALGLLLLAMTGCATPPERNTITVRDELLDSVVQPRAAEDLFAGVVLVSADGNVIHQAPYGEVTPGSGIPHRLGAEWRWASVTKMLTGLLVLQEVEKGTLTLDTELGEVLKDVPDEVAGRTIQQLLSHTSGLRNPARRIPNKDTGLQDYFTKTRRDTSYCYEKPGRAAGASFSYNECDFAVLEDVLKTVTGRPFATLVKTRLVEPYRLSGLRIVTKPNDDADVVGTEDGAPIDSALQLHTFGGGAAAVGDPADAMDLTMAIMDGKILKDEAVLNAFGEGNPRFGYVALSVWGYRGRLSGCEEPVRLIERQGDLGGTKVLVLMAPDLNRSIVAFSNRDETDWGWIWQGRGFSYDLASAAFCGAGPA